MIFVFNPNYWFLTRVDFLSIELNYLGSNKLCHTLAHRQPEKHPHWHPWECTPATIHGSFDVWLESLHQRMVHTSERGWSIHRWMNHTSEDGPYIGAPMFVHPFRRMGKIICSRIIWPKKQLKVG